MKTLPTVGLALRFPDLSSSMGALLHRRVSACLSSGCKMHPY